VTGTAGATWGIIVRSWLAARVRGEPAAQERELHAVVQLVPTPIHQVALRGSGLVR